MIDDETFEADAYASVLAYTITIGTKNRAMSPAEREAVQQAVQSALNLLSVQMQFATARDPSMVTVKCERNSSTMGMSYMYPDTEVTCEQ